MRVVLASSGPRGDIHALFSLAAELQSRGHIITLCMPEKYRSKIMKLGHRMVTCGAGFDDYLEGDRAGDFSDFTRTVSTNIPLQFVALRDALREADVLVGGTLIPAAPSMAEQVGLPYFQFIQLPMLLDSERHPCLGVRYAKAGIFESIRHRERRKEWTEVVGKVLNREREVSHLQPVSDLYKHLFHSGYSIMAFDPEAAPVSEISATGFCVFDDPIEPDTDLQSFLSAGKPPVIVERFPAKVPDVPQFVRDFCGSLISNGLRVILSPAWKVTDGLPDGCMVAESSQLSEASASIHAGSPESFIHSAVRGIPQIVVPYLVDQCYWGERVQAMGIGPSFATQMSAENIVAKVKEAMAKSAFRELALATGEKIRKRGGASAAANSIEGNAGEAIHGK